MLLRCSKCQRLYAAQSEHDPGICLYCLQAEKPDAENDESQVVMDWRDPLYEYACRLAGRNQLKAWDRMEEILIRLGDYRDCRQMLEQARMRKQKLYERIINDIQIGERRTAVQNAVEQLRDFSGTPEAGEWLAAGEEKLRVIVEREEREKAEITRRRFAQAKRRYLFSVLTAALLVMSVLAYVLVFFPGRLNRAESLIAQGQYEEALALCMKSEKVRETRRGGELLRAARTGAAGAMRTEGRFEESAELYRILDMQDELEETHLLWSDALAGQGDSRAAIEVLLRTEKSDARWTRLSALYMQRADEAAEEAIARGIQDVEYAGSLGRAIPALDAQLRYCHLLHEAGFDLTAVYPDGVSVEDAKLAALQIDAQDAREAELPLESALVFLREEDGRGYSDFPWLVYSGGSTGRDRSKDSMYSVRLMPGYMFREGASPARSFAQADTALLIDGVYIEKGKVSVWTETKLSYSVVLPKTLMKYPYFSAVSSVAAYDLRDPRRRQVFAVETSDALCDDEEWMEAHKRDYDTLSGLTARRGEMKMDEMREVLDDLLAADRAKGGDVNGAEP